jgi:transcription elongation factor Elf1
MPLNAQQKWKVEDHLAQKGIKKCPLCDAAPLKVHDKYYGMPFAEHGSALGAGLRAVVVSCGSCGLSLPFEAKQLGV